MRRLLKFFMFPGLIVIAMLVLSVQDARAGEENENILDQFPPIEWHSFVETRAGCRLQDDPAKKDISVAEARVQMELFTYTDAMEFKYKADAWADGITERGEYDTREAWFFSRPSDILDVKIGRQVLTWGTGDLVFLNDLFPKDWQSYFIGRDKEYLKAPSDAAKIGIFTEFADIDLVYTPKFDPDRYITGEYVSYWDAKQKGFSGRDGRVTAAPPDRWFRDDEIALRIYKNINNYELALYGYYGFWKRPAGETSAGAAFFPPLNVYGASVRGKIGPGIGNAEAAYYQSRDDESGANPWIRNSEIRYLAGYTWDPAKDLNASLQYYAEQMSDYGDYKANLSNDTPARERVRQVITLQLTWLLMNQNLELGLSSYYSPSDEDAYLRPSVQYKYSDTIIISAGVNLFWGEESHTFFGQFENGSNVYGGVRYSF